MKEHKCLSDESKRVYHDGDIWRLDLDDGMAGLPITHCPFCGLWLIHEFEE